MNLLLSYDAMKLGWSRTNGTSRKAGMLGILIAKEKFVDMECQSKMRRTGDSTMLAVEWGAVQMI